MLARAENSSGTLYGGIATYSTTALGAGSYSVTAVYPGDGNYAGSNSTASALTVNAIAPSFTLTSTPSKLTIQSGQSAQAVITLTPIAGYAGTVTLSCRKLPANVSCNFSTTTLTADGKNDAVQSVLTIATNGAANTTAHVDGAGRNGERRNGTARLLAALFLPGGLLLWGFAARRKRLGW